MIDRLSSSATAPTKTYVVEVHTDEPGDYLRDALGSQNVEETADAYLYRVHAGPNLSFWVDQLDERFWNFHTQDPVRDALPYLKSIVDERRELDWMWLPSAHLRHIWPGATTRRVRTEFHARDVLDEDSYSSDLSVRLSGRDADQLLDYIAENDKYRSAVPFDSVQIRLSDPELGCIDEALNRSGRFAVSGESIEFHLQFVRSIVNRYKGFVEACERRAIEWRPFSDDGDPGGLMNGAPIVIDFSKSANLSRLLDAVFSSRYPYRLWGTPVIVDAVAYVEAVDLHVGRRVRVDVGSRWLRVYLEQGGCGNTVARLISNLQTRFDSALSLRDPELQAALSAHAGSRSRTMSSD
ncbi:MAG TPA: hypothetical protein VFQ77_20140 [Pseudonocardiaceae bacterium]|jgi:hypothetical protein|nr:hypothetical protein [Pseudonocardiaceae bacterium]